MTWDDRIFRRELAKAVESNDREQTSRLISTLLGHLANSDDQYPIKSAEQVLTLLRRKRYFREVARLGDALLRSGTDDPAVRRHYAQALIEQGNLSLAQSTLEAVVADTDDDDRENREARGLLGRACKQAYVDTGDSESQRSRDMLRQAADWYWSVYEADAEQLWHGINTVAVLKRAERDGVDVDNRFPDPDELAVEILETAESRRMSQEVTTWDYAAALEACVALGRYDDASEWVADYLASPNADAFEVISTLRQMEEVWCLRPDTQPGRWLIPLLRAQVLRSDDGVLDLDATTAHAAALDQTIMAIEDGAPEAILGSEHFENLAFLQQALERASSVARIHDPSGRAWGTGFVVRASDVVAPSAAPDEPVLVTNAHVINEDATLGAGPWEEAVITFDTDETRTEYTVKEILWSSPKQELDVTVLRTDPPLSAVAAVPVAKVIPRAGSRVYVIGHPQGRALSWSIYDNELLQKDEDPYLHYRTPTEHGSSGSPVFNRDWKLIGVHHFGNRQIFVEGHGEAQPANEGISILAIRSR